MAGAKIFLKKLFFRLGRHLVLQPHRGLDVCQMVMGGAEGVGVVSENMDLSVMNRLWDAPVGSEDLSGSDGVQIDTVDAFCDRHGIKKLIT